MVELNVEGNARSSSSMRYRTKTTHIDMDTILEEGVLNTLAYFLGVASGDSRIFAAGPQEPFLQFRNIFDLWKVLEEH